MADAPLECPQCGSPLTPVKVHARTGYMLQLDQCKRCGGLWCDKFELYPIASSEVDRLDPVDRDALHKTAPAPAERHCPRCQIALRHFSDPLLPDDVLIDRCPLCEGMWLNAGSLRRYDEYRRHGQTPKPISNDLVQALTEHCREPAKWSTVQNLSSAVDSPAPDPDADAGRTGRALWEGAAWLALRFLLQLFIRL